MITRNDILSSVQKLCDNLYREPVSDRCTDAAQFVLRTLDYALSAGKEEELARLVQPWLQNTLFDEVKGMVESAELKNPGSIYSSQTRLDDKDGKPSR